MSKPRYYTAEGAAWALFSPLDALAGALAYRYWGGWYGVVAMMTGYAIHAGLYLWRYFRATP